ncbi:MAG: S41 family peptidase [Mangrovibacterium sp.]
MKKLLSYLFLLLVLVYSCKDDDEPIVEEEDPIAEEILATNAWIRENMEDLYLWNNKLPDIDDTKEANSEEYFYKLIYEAEDKWSWITDDYASLAAEFAGVPVTMGFDPAFYLFSDGSSVYIVVNYVYPGSAAEEAGLKRGDIILSINNTNLNTENYYTLYSGNAYSVQLGSLSGSTISPSGISYSLTARVTSTNPSVHYEVIETEGHKIGYLAYVEFVAGTNDGFLETLDQIFTEFNTTGITDLIVDLRYNPGGEIDAAAYLASEIAPANVVSAGEVLVGMRYNDELQSYLEYSGEEYADYLSYRFLDDVNGNVNLQRVFFLTTTGTASASELLITGLEPYMDVVHIGEPTYGKYTGAWVIPDDQEEWAMVPIVLKYANTFGYTDFKDGLTPDYVVEDDVLAGIPFGDTSDPMVAKAIELITGQTTTVAVAKSSRIKVLGKQLFPKALELKKNLFVPVPELSR